MDLTDHVILDKDSYLQLQTAAWDSPPATAGDRMAATAQVAGILGACAAAFVLGAWGVAKIQDWREEKHLQRLERQRSVERQA